MAFYFKSVLGLSGKVTLPRSTHHKIQNKELRLNYDSNLNTPPPHFLVSGVKKSTYISTCIHICMQVCCTET